MKLVIQRVTHASVVADGEMSGKIGPGLMLLLGVEQGDTLEQALQLATKVLKIRLWPDLKNPQKQWSSSVVDIGYEILVVSQFTLFATFKKPKPDFHQAMGGDEAKSLYEAFVEQCRAGSGDPSRVATGVFGALMQVELCNDGPVTVELVAESTADKSAAADIPLSGKGPEQTKMSRQPKAASAQLRGSAVEGSPGAQEEALLTHQPYLGGFEPSYADAELFVRCSGVVPDGMPHLSRWCEHIASYTALERLQWQ
mmetsp:Transcript_161590/g.513544  ORF Transcript_161590/g.513544 Transcript_161590/m.513544 type:complete len:255 (+) Transcript_161590:77-841(+)